MPIQFMLLLLFILGSILALLLYELIVNIPKQKKAFGFRKGQTVYYVYEKTFEVIECHIVSYTLITDTRLGIVVETKNGKQFNITDNKAYTRLEDARLKALDFIKKARQDIIDAEKIIAYREPILNSPDFKPDF